MAKDSLEEETQTDEQTTAENTNVVIEALPVTPTIVSTAGGADVEPIAVLVEEPEGSSEVLQAGGRREIVRSATLVMLGTLGGSVMGMVRQITLSSFGAAISGPFLGALSPTQKFYDFTVNGSVPGALVPTFNDYAIPEKREELRRLVFTLVNFILLVMAVSSVAFLFVAPWLFTNYLAKGYSFEGQLLTIQFSRIIFFSLLALGPFAILQAALYARKEFGWPALAPAAFHTGIIIGAIFAGIVGTHYFGTYGLGFGVLLGALGEILVLIPGLRKQGLRYMFVLDLRHSAIRQILKLYAPVALGLIVTIAVALLDQALATSTPCASFMLGSKDCGEANFSAMGFATTLVQFPIGLVASALSFAVLPTLTTYAREGEMERFKDTLLLGFRLGLLLTIPAAAGLIMLQMPIAALIFQHGAATRNGSMLVATALQNYSYQLPFVAIDQLLIAAFYARKNTIIPVTVGVVAVLGYLAVALPFWNTIGMPALPLANTTQIVLHALVLLVLLRMAIGSMHIRNMVPAVLKMLLATAAMVAVAWGLQLALAHIGLFSLDTLIGRFLTVVVVGGLAAGVYFGCIMVLKVEEVALLKGVVLAKLGKK